MTNASYQPSPRDRRPAKAIAYVRCSTEEQRESGLGLEAQRAAITEAADRLELVIRAWHADEGISGAADVFNRPGLLKALSELRRGDVLLVARMDRIARDVDVAGEIRMLVRRRRARITSAAENENGGDDSVSTMTRRMNDLMAEQYRLAVSERTKAALAAKRRRGESVSRFPPYGWHNQDGHWVEDAHEQAGIQLARELRKHGHSYQDVARILFRRGYASRSGTKLTATAVRRALLR